MEHNVEVCPKRCWFECMLVCIPCDRIV